MTSGLRVILGTVHNEFKISNMLLRAHFCISLMAVLALNQNTARNPSTITNETHSARSQEQTGHLYKWFGIFFFSSLCHGYLIISQGKRWVRSANKRCLNKLAPGHIIQTQGIVLSWQASTGHEQPEKLLLGWVGLDQALTGFRGGKKRKRKQLCRWSVSALLYNKSQLCTESKHKS